jgi:hypothetical protein
VTDVSFNLLDDNLITEEQFVHIPPHENHATELPAGIGHCFIFLYFNNSGETIIIILMLITY